MADQAGPTRLRDRLLDTATGLFAGLGHDQTTLRMVAEAAGLTTADVTAEFGSIGDLYVAVMQRAAAEQEAMLEAGSAEFTHDAAGIHRFLDRYLDFYVDHPQIAALWMQRRLSDAADLAQIERSFSVAPQERVAEVVGDTVGADVDVELSLWIIEWSVHTFVRGGIPTAEGGRVGPENRKILARFRAHLHQMVERMIGLEH